MKEFEDEAWVVFEVTEGQTARLGYETKDPFQPGALHPSGSAALAAGDEIEGRADGKHHGGHPAHMLDNPVFLLGAAEANEEQARSRGIDAINHGPVFFRRKRPKGWAFLKGHDEIRVAQTRGAEESLENGRASAVEAYWDTVGFCRRQQCGRRVRSADPLSASLTERTERPDERDTVGEDHIGGIEPAPVSRIVNGFHNHVNTGEKERAGLALPGPTKTQLNYFIATAGGNVDSKDGAGNDEILRLGGGSHG